MLTDFDKNWREYGLGHEIIVAKFEQRKVGTFLKRTNEQETDQAVSKAMKAENKNHHPDVIDDLFSKARTSLLADQT